MEKLETKIAEKLFNDVEAQYEECYSVTYGASRTPVKIYKNISMIDLNTIVDIVTQLAFADGEYNHLKREVGVAATVVKYLTDIPMKMIESEDGSEIDDMSAYYQIVFGNDGLYDRRKPSYWIINKIEMYIDRAVEVKKEEHSPLGRLCNRIMELGKEFNKSLDSFLNDPDALEGLNNLVDLASAQTKSAQN